MKRENINVFELRSLVACKIISKHEANRYVRKKLGLDEKGKPIKEPKQKED